MSDDTAAPPRPQATGIWEHYCQHPGCKLWGGYGYARGKGEYDWFCYEHRPDRAAIIKGDRHEQGQI